MAYRMTPKRRVALRKAQAVSARKRRKGGSSRRRKVAIGVAVAGSAAVAGYHTRNRVREGALKKRHGADYLPKKFTAYHHTNNNAARRITRTKNWKPTGKNGGHGSKHGVWMTRQKHDPEMRAIYGDAQVRVRVNRREVIHRIPHGNYKRGNMHVQVHKKTLQGRKVRNNLANSSKAIRRRQGPKYSKKTYKGTWI